MGACLRRSQLHMGQKEPHAIGGISPTTPQID